METCHAEPIDPSARATRCPRECDPSFLVAGCDRWPVTKPSVLGGARLHRSRAGRPAVRHYPASIFSTKRVRSLPGSAVRLLLWAEAGWHPTHGAVLPQHHVADALGLRRTTVATAITYLIEAELMTLKTPAVKPAAMGAAGPGRAAGLRPATPEQGRRRAVRPGREEAPRICEGLVRRFAFPNRAVEKAAARVLLIVAAVPRDRDGTLLRPD